MTALLPGSDLLDNPGWAGLAGAHARFAQVRGRAARYHPDVSPFHTVADVDDPLAWADLAGLAGPGAEVLVTGPRLAGPAGWTTTAEIPGVQLIDAGLAAAPDPEAVALGTADLAEILDLVARTRPGPFRPRTIELGGYLGIRRGGALVAMAGQRLHPPGWTEISAVCTDPAYRGRGLAARLILAVAHGIRERGETPFLHAALDNTGAIRLYEKLGFVLRTEVVFGVYRTPPRA